jgi:hypothetical protein
MYWLPSFFVTIVVTCFALDLAFNNSSLEIGRTGSNEAAGLLILGGGQGGGAGGSIVPISTMMIRKVAESDYAKAYPRRRSQARRGAQRWSFSWVASIGIHHSICIATY